jgi:regulator of cell morphogenesis and NO signaling
MTTIDPATTVAELVVERPGRARVFERLGIDYCCGGKVSLEHACATKGLEPTAVTVFLEAIDSEDDDEGEADWSTATLADLCDHIVTRHHAYLREELPRLSALVEKVAAAHREANPELDEVADVFEAIAAELQGHMFVEEAVLFRACRDLEAQGWSEVDSLAGPVGAMEADHEGTGAALERLRVLTADYTPPPAACNSYLTMLDGLETLERDLHRHIHEENNILFPRALALEGAARPS